MVERKTLSLEEAAAMLKIEPRTLQNWIYANKDGIRDLVRKVGGKTTIFWEDELAQWIDDHKLANK